VIVAKEDEAATDSADEFPPGAVAPPTGTTTTGRSVSVTLQRERERERARGGARASPRSSNASDSRVNAHRSPRAHPSTLQEQQHAAHGSTRENFLNFFFGQNGPGPIGASSAVSVASVSGGGPVTLLGGGPDVIASGRDLTGGADVVLRSGLLAGNHDGNRAVYDMKSLGKHIEAVRSLTRLYLGSGILGTGELNLVGFQHTGCCEWDAADREGGDGNQLDPVADYVILFDCSGEHTRPDTQGDHAPPREPQRATGAESARECAVQACVVRGAARRGRGAGRRAHARQGATRGLQGRV